MKKLRGILVLTNLAMVATNAGAAETKAKTVLSCGNGEEINLVVKKAVNGTFQAAVTMESFGGSFPTFHYSVARTSDGYQGGGFSLYVHQRQGKHLGELEIQALSIREELDCL